MNEFNRKISLIFIIFFAVSYTQNLWATKRHIEEIGDFEQPQKLKKLKSCGPLQEALQNIKNFKYVSNNSLNYLKDTALGEIKQLELKIRPDNDIFDSLITLILLTFPNEFYFNEILKVAKEKGDCDTATSAAQYNLGFMYRHGIGVDPDLDKAIIYYQKSADRGHAGAQNSLAFIYDQKQEQAIDRDLIKILELYEGAANQGFASAQYNLGYLYIYGKGVHTDSKKAFKYFQKAALQEHAGAQYELGCMYQRGQHVQISFKKSFECFQRSANQGHTAAQFGLGCIYYHGIGVNQNLANSLKWCLESSKNLNINKDGKIKLKNLMESLVSFVTSTITLNDEKYLINNQEMLKLNVESCLKLHRLKKEVNDPNLCVQEIQWIIPSLYKIYHEIVNFEEILLKIINSYSQPGFMVTCLQPKAINDFKLSYSRDIKCYEFQDQYFLTFGQNNIEVANNLMDILLDNNKNHSFSEAVEEIIEIQKQRKRNYQIDAISIQSKILRKSVSEDQMTELQKTFTNRNSLIETVEKEIIMLNQLKNFTQQLKTLLIKGISYRNKLFLNDNKYIELIFKN